MILYNTTFVVSDAIQSLFLNWIKEKFIPQANSTGVFHSPLLTRIINDSPEQVGQNSFAMQFKCDSLEIAKKWHDNIGTNLMSELGEKYKYDFLYFTTFMDII